MAAIEIRGLRELQRTLRRFSEDAVDELRDTNAAAAKIVEREADRRVPVRSGKLKSTVRSSGQKTKGVVRVGRKSVPYAGPIHFGWSTRPNIKFQAGRPAGGPIGANPFLYDALDDRRAKVLREYERQLRKIVNRYS